MDYICRQMAFMYFKKSNCPIKRKLISFMKSFLKSIVSIFHRKRSLFFIFQNHFRLNSHATIPKPNPPVDWSHKIQLLEMERTLPIFLFACRVGHIIWTLHLLDYHSSDTIAWRPRRSMFFPGRFPSYKKEEIPPLP